MTNSQFVTEWVLDEVKKHYADDIALVISHTTLRLDETEKAVSYFVPVTERGRTFARTFILAGEGFDIWGIEWDRLERFARLEEYNITCLADGELLYARTPADARRFEELKKAQAKRLSDPLTARRCALEAYGQAKSVLTETLFAQSSDAKYGVGYVLDYLAQAVAFTNGRYFKKSQTDQIRELQTMERVPDGFLDLYRAVITERGDNNQKKMCCELIKIVQKFLEQNNPQPDQPGATPAPEQNFQDLADWYAELSYTWLRIRSYCRQKDAIKVYMWGIYLQKELNDVCRDFGLPKMELMTAYDTENLATFAELANWFELQMRAIIQNGGGIIREYRTVGEFLNEV